MAWNIKDDSHAIEETEAQWRARQDDPRPPLAPAVRYALNVATRSLHDSAWHVAQVGIDLNDCETLVLHVLIDFDKALARFHKEQ